MTRLQTLCAVLAGAAAFLAGSGAMAQQDHVPASGKLSDSAFHRLVACGAAPGGECQINPIRWSERDAMRLTVAIVAVDGGLKKAYVDRSRKALSQAIAQINGAGAAVRMTHADSNPMIRIRLVNTKERFLIENEGDWNYDINAFNAAAYLQYDLSGSRIRGCDIAVGSESPMRYLQRLFLEEMTQCLGLPFDILNRQYRNRSIFSELGARAKTLKGQDAAVVRLHYPPGG